MDKEEQSICTCVCHRKDIQIMHCFPCCDLTYQTYLDEKGKVIPKQLSKLLKQHAKQIKHYKKLPKKPVQGRS